MPRFRPKDAPPEVSSTPFSEFIRTASSEEKKKVYSKVGSNFLPLGTPLQTRANLRALFQCRSLLRQAHDDCGDRLGPVRHGGHLTQNLAVAEVQQLNRLRGLAAARVGFGTIVVEHQLVERRKYRT